MNNKIIPKVRNLKYLGIHFSQNFKFNFHTDKIRNKMLAAYFSLKNIFTNKKVDKQIKLLAYKQIIRPIRGTHIIERKILEASTGLHRKPGSVKYYRNEEVYAECNLNTIGEELITSTTKFLDKINLEVDPFQR